MHPLSRVRHQQNDLRPVLHSGVRQKSHAGGAVTCNTAWPQRVAASAAAGSCKRRRLSTPQSVQPCAALPPCAAPPPCPTTVPPKQERRDYTRDARDSAKKGKVERTGMGGGVRNQRDRAGMGKRDRGPRQALGRGRRPPGRPPACLPPARKRWWQQAHSPAVPSAGQERGGSSAGGQGRVRRWGRQGRAAERVALAPRGLGYTRAQGGES